MHKLSFSCWKQMLCLIRVGELLPHGSLGCPVDLHVGCQWSRTEGLLTERQARFSSDLHSRAELYKFQFDVEFIFLPSTTKQLVVPAMLFLRLSRAVTRPLVPHGRNTTNRVRFVNTTSSNSKHVKTSRTAASLEYKGRIVKDAPAEAPTVASTKDVPTPDPAPASPKSEPTKDQKYRTASRRWTGILIGAPIAIVTSYFLYRRCKSYFQNLHVCFEHVLMSYA